VAQDRHRCQPDYTVRVALAHVTISGQYVDDKTGPLVMNNERNQAGRYTRSKQDHAETNRTWRAVNRIPDDFPFTLFGLPGRPRRAYSHAEEPPVSRILNL
jgi:hypothetical protein